MKMQKNIIATLLAIVLILPMAISLNAQTYASGEVINGINYDKATADAIKDGMKWDINYNASTTRLLMYERYDDKVPTWTYAVISPNPVGVGQKFTIVMFNPQVPLGASDSNDIRYQYTVEIKTPSGEIVKLPSSGTFISDSTGTTYASYTPDVTGNYSVTVKFEELYWRWSESSTPRQYYGITLLSSNRTYTVAVQDEPVYPTAVTSYPLPTEYWSRPIEGQNNEWGQVSSNWLNNAMDRTYQGPNNRIQTQGSAPNSGHILWTKPTEDGGVVGGDDLYSKPGEVFNAGHQYQTRMKDTSIIMHGRLYYQEPITWSGTGGAWVCVDLKTGEEIWRNVTMNPQPSFGYYYDFDSMNQHGIANPGWIFSSSWQAIHPRYGTSTTLKLDGVPSGTEVVGPKGEILRYVLQREGQGSARTWQLYQWNSSRVLVNDMSSASSGTQNASLTAPTHPFDFNVTVNLPATSYSQNYANYDDVLLVSNGTLPKAGSSALQYHNAEESTLTAISLKEGEEGRVLWTQNYDMTFNDGTQSLFIRAADGVFVMQHFPELKYMVYDLYTGKLKWESEPQADFNPFGYFSWVSLMNDYGTSISHGKLFTTGYTGAVIAYDLYNGTKLWTQEALTGGEIFKYYTLFHGVTADNKIYIGTHEHSADTPLLKGAKVRVYDVNTGEEIWSMLGWANPGTMAIADGVLTYWNNYDHQVYAVGKGASSTTVEIANDVVPAGQSVMIKGNVIDVSPGTQQSQQSLRFPNGVPAVSDESQSAWMEYVYMQKPRPTNVTGVTVELSVVDANGNYRSIGTATADADGFFSLPWTPDIQGKYTVYASFGGSESYWPSHAVTAFNVDPAPATPTPVPTQAPSMADLYFLPAIAGIIIAIVVVGLLTILMLRKRP